MSLMNERVNVITHSSILGQSMLRVNVKAHDEIAAKMAEWESKNKVTVVPMGASSDKNPLRPGSDSRQEEAIKRRIQKSK